jgi:hypothetical protein
MARRHVASPRGARQQPQSALALRMHDSALRGHRVTGSDRERALAVQR